MDTGRITRYEVLRVIARSALRPPGAQSSLADERRVVHGLRQRA